jgi:hypothetical protein
VSGVTSEVSSPLLVFQKRILLLQASRPGLFPAASFVTIELDLSLASQP